MSDLAAHWRCADSSHFIRALKKHHGRTPADYARSIPDRAFDSSAGPKTG